jgi:hypothetical protein
LDPITINKLLSVADAIETHRVENELSLDTLHKIINSQGQIKHLERRVRDILRIFEASRWITRNNQSRDILYLTENYHKFIHAWNSGDYLLPMNQGLINYPPYARFLNCLKRKKRIEIPQRQDKESRRNLGRDLKEKYDITFVAFDTFRIWAVSVGHAYRSPFEEILYWGGDWNAEYPSLDCFKVVCRESYSQTNKTSGYANLGYLAHLVCKKLSISFQAFEMKINQFIETFPGEIKLAPATIRCEVSGHFQIISIRPRKEILRERFSAKLQGIETQGIETPQSQWLEHRYLEDGMRVNRKLVKLIRWEVSK